MNESCNIVTVLLLCYLFGLVGKASLKLHVLVRNSPYHGVRTTFCVVSLQKTPRINPCVCLISFGVNSCVQICYTNTVTGAQPYG